MLFPFPQDGMAIFDPNGPTKKCCIFLGSFALSSAANRDDVVVAATTAAATVVVVVVVVVLVYVHVAIADSNRVCWFGHCR